MIVIRCAQGSPEWLAARAGVITASMFCVARERVGGLDERQQAYVDAIRAGNTEAEAVIAAGYKSKPRSSGIERALAGQKVGDFSPAAKDYAFRLAVERISGTPLDEGFQTWAMQRGHELEPAARLAHEIAIGVVVERAGFVTTDDGVFGASADGLIGDNSGSEYKCLVAPARLRAVHIDGDMSEFIDQVQGCMWITGRKTWHFGLYCPALAPIGREFWHRVVERDDNYIEAMEADLIEFKALVDSLEAQLRDTGERAAA